MTAPRRRWFSFSLRTLFAVMTVFCIVGGWVAYQLNWIRQRHDSYEWLDTHGAYVDESGPGVPWALAILGETRIADFWCIGRLDDESSEEYRAGLARVAGLFPECRFIDGEKTDAAHPWGMPFDSADK